MKSLRIFMAFTFLLAFAFPVSAQDKTPKIVWKNLLEKYENFNDIKPIVVNVSDKPIFFHDRYPAIRLAYFDEAKNEWQTNYPFACGTGVKANPLKLISQANAALSLDAAYWKLNFEVMPTDIDILQSFKRTGTGKFRLELNYGIKKSEMTETIISPEFQVKV